MQTREQIRASLISLQNRHVYVFVLNDQSLITEPLHPLTERDIAKDVEIAITSQTGNLERAKTGKLSEGDVIHCLDGTIERVASVLERQTGNVTTYQPGHCGTGGSFYLYDDSMGFSGSWDYPVERQLRLSGETTVARVWFFSHRQAGGGRGVYCNVSVPVWIEV